MLWFTLRRAAGAIVVLFAVSVMVFLIFFVTPGVDPAARIAGRNASPATLELVRHSFGLDRPLPIQYLLMMKGLLISGDLTSYVNRGQKVLPEILRAAPVTISLVAGAAVLWMIVSFILGTLAGALHGTFIDPIIMILGVIGISLPVFWLGEVVNLFTQSRWHDSAFHWVPPLGYVPFSTSPAQWALHLLFPWMTLAVLYAGIYSRVLRSQMVEVLHADYIRTARAKGLSESRILVRHALRCSLIPLVELFGLDFGVLVGGSALLVEVVFALPGVGLVTYNALQNVDLPVIMGTVAYTSFFVVLTSAAVDVLHARLDPRVRQR